MKIRMALVLLTVILLSGPGAARAAGPAIVPAPAMLETTPGSFALTPGTAIEVEPGLRDVREIGGHLAGYLEQAGLPRPLILDARGPEPSYGAILLTTAEADDSLGDEGYRLVITPQGIRLGAPTAHGLFNGIQTIRQLLPAGRVLDTVRAADGTFTARLDRALPCLTIVDKPRYPWRGMLLDCCRHFMPPDTVKRCIDLLALHKMNVLHWHLTEDQGWRLPVEKYPRLIEVGAWRGEGERRSGGFYTRKEVEEIVAYAASRHVTVVPEIEMPGHARAALAAHPELSCTGGPFAVGTRWGVYKDVYCAGNDEVFVFLENVLDEVLELFPSEYIHIGGDECPKDRWRECKKCQARIKEEGLADEDELQSWFIRRIEAYLNEKGRRLIGWDEILEGGLAPNATVQSWRGMDGAVAAARAGHDVIASPITHCYFDYPQLPDPSRPAWMGIISWERTYGFEPTPPELTPEQARHVLGAEGNVWTERIPPERVERMLLPRLSALAEVTWSPAGQRSWDSFFTRMKTHFSRLDALGVDYFIPPPHCRNQRTVFTDRMEVVFDCPLADGEIRYTLDGSEPGTGSPVYVRPIPLEATTRLRACTVAQDGRVGEALAFLFNRQDPLAPVTPRKTKPGMTYRSYTGELQSLEHLAEAVPADRGTTAGLTLGVRPRERYYAIVFDGYLEAPADGVYTFFLTSDDGSRLFIGDREVVDNDGRHGSYEVWGQVILKAGLHPVKVEYFQGHGFQNLQLEYAGPGFDRRPVPASAFSH